jgi:hypothetical protein
MTVGGLFPRHEAIETLIRVDGVLGLPAGEKCFPLLRNDAVQQARFGMSGRVVLRLVMHNPSRGMHQAN